MRRLIAAILVLLLVITIIMVLRDTGMAEEIPKALKTLGVET